MKYNHKGKNVLETTGVDAFDISVKAADLFPESGEVNSVYIETLENSFSKRELAVLASMFIGEMNTKDDTSKRKVKIEVVNLGKGALPQEVLDFVKDKVKNGLDNIDEKIKILSFDPTCSCPKCTNLRTKAMLSNEKSSAKIQGEGGNC